MGKVSGLPIEAVAKKIDITPDRLAACWESGEQRPTFAQLRRLAEIYRRPLATFYLEVAPLGFQPMHYFRRLAAHEGMPQSPELTVEIRKAHDRREWALALFREIESDPPQVLESITGDQDPEAAAGRVRQFLGVSLQQQTTWKDQYEAFKEVAAAYRSSGNSHLSGNRRRGQRGARVLDQ